MTKSINDGKCVENSMDISKDFDFLAYKILQEKSAKHETWGPILELIQLYLDVHL